MNGSPKAAHLFYFSRPPILPLLSLIHQAELGLASLGDERGPAGQVEALLGPGWQVYLLEDGRFAGTHALEHVSRELLRVGHPLLHAVQDDGDEAHHPAVMVPGFVAAEMVDHVVRVSAVRGGGGKKDKRRKKNYIEVKRL